MEWWIGFSEIVRNFGLLLAAAIGVVLAGLRVVAANRQANASLRQAELARREHVAALFNRAVEQLDHEELQVRLGAIGADFPDLTGAVFELLSAYLRERDAAYGDETPPPDIREIMRLVRERLQA